MVFSLQFSQAKEPSPFSQRVFDRITLSKGIHFKLRLFRPQPEKVWGRRVHHFPKTPTISLALTASITQPFSFTFTHYNAIVPGMSFGLEHVMEQLTPSDESEGGLSCQDGRWHEFDYGMCSVLLFVWVFSFNYGLDLNKHAGFSLCRMCN